LSTTHPTYGEQEGSAYNGHFGCTCYHSLFVFNQLGDLERSALRPGNVHSADGWREVLEPVVSRYRGRVKRLYFRGDAAFANPEIYELLEAEGMGYAVRLPANRVLQDKMFLAEPSPSHARGPALLSCAGNRPHIPLMAGSPLKRQRKAGIRADDGSVIAFPYMPRVADLPRGWRHWSPAQKIEHLLGMTLDDIAEIMSWGPIAELDPFRLSVRMQVTRIVFMIGMKAWLNGTLGREAARERDPVLEKLSLELRTQLRERTAPET
jgi:hypothetical protein